MDLETDSLDGQTMSVAEMSQLIGLRPRRLQYLVTKGIVPPPDRGRYDVVGVVQGYVKFLAGDAPRSATIVKPSALQDARAREIEANIARRSEAMKANALDACIALVDASAGGLKVDLLSIPARVTTDLPLRRRIEGEITAALQAASGRCAKAAKSHGRRGA